MRIRVVVVLLVVIAGVFLVNSFINNPQVTTQPDATFILWEDASVRALEGAAGNILTAKGMVTNNHDSWSVKNVRIEMKMIDKEDNIIDRRDIAVKPPDMPPGERGDYYEKIQLPSYCASVDLNVVWDWVSPGE